MLQIYLIYHLIESIQRISHFVLLVGAIKTAGGGHHDSVTHAGVTIHKAAKWHVYTGEAMAGLMWYVSY